MNFSYDLGFLYIGSGFVCRDCLCMVVLARLWISVHE